jgi:hypothetical protein
MLLADYGCFCACIKSLLLHHYVHGLSCELMRQKVGHTDPVSRVRVGPREQLLQASSLFELPGLGR